MKIINIFAAAILILSHTDTAKAYSISTKISEIKFVTGNIDGTGGGDKILISFSDITWHGCGGSRFFVMNEGDSVSIPRQQLLSIAMTAAATNRTVYIVTANCDGNGYEWVQQISYYP
ncbi:hypothetical protein [Nitrospirillum amazonense]|uniref:hypothetical protein n=1 Tax=Nitrospirillum amazonense TaxID=28077 RepID=UPI0011A5CBDE|nr:hypothetical protein [Nitrospirillum amazonense]